MITIIQLSNHEVWWTCEKCGEIFDARSTAGRCTNCSHNIKNDKK